MAPGKSDDVVPSEYPYSWSPDSKTTLEDYLNKYKPSMVQDDGTKPWLWVSKASLDNEADSEEKAVAEATEYLRDVTERVEKIQNDPEIPVRSNKKKGLKSKKELREEVQNEAAEKLKEISVRHGYVKGKWLIFAPTERVDAIWSTIANSLISGPLAATTAFRAKVATCPRIETPNYSHVMCLYMPDVYDRDSVTKVMRILLRQHGLNLTGVKSDLYTMIGIDSKHASGIQSTVWKNTALLKDSEIKSLKDEYFAELSKAKTAQTPAVAKEGTAGTSAKPKLVKKKKAALNPFASDDDEKDTAKSSEQVKDLEGDGSASSKPASALKKSKPKAKPKKRSSDWASDDDAEAAEEESKAEDTTQKTATKRKAPAAKRENVSDSDEAEEAQSAKQRRRRN